MLDFWGHNWEILFMEANFARVNMIDFVSEEALEEVKGRYAKIWEKTYPGLEFTVNVRTGPKSMMSLSIFDSEAALLATTDNHQQFIASSSELVKDIFFYEGGVSALASTLVTDGFVTFDNEKWFFLRKKTLGHRAPWNLVGNAEWSVA